jgi:S1-C subfamily serine protease
MSRSALPVAFIVALMAVLSLGCASSGHARRGPELARFIENSDATYRVDTAPAGHGSGVVISREGHILTAHHVVEGETSLTISINEGGAAPRSYTATVIATDPEVDLAVIKIERGFRAPAVLEDMENLHAGDAVYNIGYPYDFGEMVGRGHIVRLRYSRPESDSTVRDVLLVQIADGPGTSGSGIYATSSGRLVGIMRMLFWVTNGRVPPLVVCVATPVDQIRAFLDRNRIPYVRSSDVAMAAPAHDRGIARLSDDTVVSIAPARL